MSVVDGKELVIDDSSQDLQVGLMVRHREMSTFEESENENEKSDLFLLSGGDKKTDSAVVTDSIQVGEKRKRTEENDSGSDIEIL